MGYRCYSDLKKLATHEERYEYLKLSGRVGANTWGGHRHVNQMLYRSNRWLAVRDKVIIRDLGCDLGMSGHEIYDSIIVHHMNPISLEQIENGDDSVFDPEGLICTRLSTHNAIHYGVESLTSHLPIIRSRNDTTPWAIKEEYSDGKPGKRKNGRKRSRTNGR